MAFNPKSFAVDLIDTGVPAGSMNAGWYSSLMPALRQQGVDRQKRATAEAAAAAARWEAARAALNNERVGPSKLERVASALTAFGAPTEHGNFFEALNAANKNMMQTGQESALAVRARKQQLAELAFKQEEALAQQRSSAADAQDEITAQQLALSTKGLTPQEVGGNLIGGDGRVIYSAPEKPLAMDGITARAYQRQDAGTASSTDLTLIRVYENRVAKVPPKAKPTVPKDPNAAARAAAVATGVTVDF
jgi:hypothetical protein